MRIHVLVTVFLVFFLIGCKGEKKYHDEQQDVLVEVATDKIADILKFQHNLNEEFKNPDKSPLPDRYRKDFEGLDFFAPDTNYVVKARLVRTPNALPFLMSTTGGEKSKEMVYGVLKFDLNGKQFELQVYQNEELMLESGYEDYLFLPFSDLTNGNETYEGGRYLDLRIPEGDEIVLDFNRAYNPYCVYNKKYSCPLVPPVNNLDTKILAGVKKFDKK